MTISVVLVPEIGDLKTCLVSWDERSAEISSFQEDIRGILEESDYLETPLLRPSEGEAGLYAYYNIPNVKDGRENIRATRLAMACGLLSTRFFGPVLMVRSFGGKWQNLAENEIYGASSISSDLRESIQVETNQDMGGAFDRVPEIPEWLANAAQQNYHDGAELAKVISAMNPSKQHEDSSGSDSDNTVIDEVGSQGDNISHSEFVAKSPLCLHCRRPASDSCQGCYGAYFCTPAKTGKDCGQNGWSHFCLCPTWKVYCAHRTDLSNFDDFFDSWQTHLTTRPHQLGEEAYIVYLQHMGIDVDGCLNWWRTEMGGWSGGESTSATEVDASVRLSYVEGFAPVVAIPPQSRVTLEDLENAGLDKKKNSFGITKLSSWKDYYRLRRIPPSSPVSLLCTFPLTIYRAIEQYGEVPVTVARMLKRPLRIHIVGAEKELNFLDLFQEVAFLMPPDVDLELVFVVREDMLPPKCQSTRTNATGKFAMRVDFESLVVGLVAGTYGGAKLDPNFDCGTGPPDMIIAMNAGLYAYESWRSVVNYLYQHKGVVGIFSDYNEYSGVNCAALGGAKSRRSLCINPFRQPRCMPVYSMNLPQFSNGFLYVFNEQELE